MFFLHQQLQCHTTDCLVWPVTTYITHTEHNSLDPNAINMLRLPGE